MLVIAGFVSGCMAQIAPTPERWIKTTKMRAPSDSTLYICHAFGCKLSYAFKTNQDDLDAMTKILTNDQENAEQERKAMGKLIQYFEVRVGPSVGSDKDKGGLDLHNSGTPGQMDCIDEASNTTSYLLFAQQKGLLKHHTISSPVARGFFLDGRYPHAAAVVKQKGSDSLYAIDSWVKDNGEFPVIKPLDEWFAERPQGL